MAYIKFGNYEPERETITTDLLDGTDMQHLYLFANGYGASVVQNRHSYGHNDGLYELMVLKDAVPCYDTPITNDVIGYLTADEVTEYLKQIEKLPDLQKEKITWNKSE
uniref:Uncharacterized protein n=1 Tax=Podoviridae sp. ctuch15 TaxID=2827752 RepID=A0A8S5T240_9CAUD|nr:MAG TPA: hypothetical protein [Podoviridae sp. ctuch15]